MSDDRFRPCVAYIGLGSNLHDPLEQINRALEALKRLPGTRFVKASKCYRSAPLGPPGQPDYVNAVAAIETRLPPFELLTALQAIENAQGRVREGQRWAPRTLDLDLLVYGEETLATETLTVPHPQMHLREFVLYPLFEIAPDLHIPGLGALREWLARCPRRGLAPINSDTP